MRSDRLSATQICIAKIELLNKYEAMMEELKAEADSIRNSIKAEMEAREVEELICLSLE